jgi:hypothetical protein
MEYVELRTRKSGLIRGSFVSSSSRPFVACRAIGLAEADPFAVPLRVAGLCVRFSHAGKH